MASYAPSADQQLLRDEVRRVLTEEHPFQPRRGASAPDIWPQALELGWPVALLTEDAGGIGGLTEAALLAEEFGRALRPEPLDLIGAMAYAAVKTGETALAEDILNGARPALSPEPGVVWGAHGADEVLVATPDGGVARVKLDAPGVTLTRAQGFDGRMIGTLSLGGETPKATLPAAFLAEATAAYLVLASATAIGHMSRAEQLAAGYLNTRHQFGVALATFQALQHALADIHIEIELARSMVNYGVEAVLEADPAARDRAVAAVKARVAEAGQIVGAKAVQLHGGVGVTEEFEVGHHYRRLIAFDLTAGSRAAHLQRFAELA